MINVFVAQEAFVGNWTVFAVVISEGSWCISYLVMVVFQSVNVILVFPVLIEQGAEASDDFQD